MSMTLSKEVTQIERLSAILLSTLDESFFFSELAVHLNKHIGADKVHAFRAFEDGKVEQVCKAGKAVLKGICLEKGVGPAGHVIRTKKAYFSNDTSRDPLFHQELSEGIKRELALPIQHEGVVIGTVHFQIIDGELEFSREHITAVLEILSKLSGPLANMKMYLSAKSLNESLLRQIEQKELELKEKSSSNDVESKFKVEEGKIVGKSKIMEEAVRRADKVSASAMNVLIQGEKGTGKDLLARRIHCRSERKSFVVVDCSIMTESQLERELFGEETHDMSRGHRVIVGALENAHGGTLFLKNVDRLPVQLQGKIAHFMKEKTGLRVGGHTAFRGDARIICSSSRNLRSLVQEGCFREDLMYSLATMIIDVPSLRERGEDIEIIATYYLNLGREKSAHKSLSQSAIKSLTEYNWPGNVRELMNVVERAYILGEGMIVEKCHLAECVVEKADESQSLQDELMAFAEMTLSDLERRHITNTLEHLSGNKTRTAKVLGITVKTLYNKLHSYGMIETKEA